METTYTELLTRIKDKVSEIKFIDLDSGQLDIPEKNYSVDNPAVFISFGSVNWGAVGNGVESGPAEIQFRIALPGYNDTNSLAPDITRSSAMTNLAIRKKVCAALHGFLGTNFNELQHVSTNQEPREDGLLVFAETYSTLLVDNSAVPTTDTVESVSLQIQVEE